MAYEGMAPEVYADQILTRLNDATVYGQVVNRDYEGDVQNFGDSVVISEIGAVTISTYTPSSTSALSPQTVPDAQQILRLDQSKSYAMWVDKVSMKQAIPKPENDMMDQAAWGFANNIDEYIAAFHSSAGTKQGNTTTGVDITSTNVMRIFTEAAAAMRRNNAPPGTWWMVMPPEIYSKMVLAGLGLDTNNSAALARGGFVGQFYGFAVYVSNNVVAQSATAGSERYAVMAGYRGSISLAVQIINTERVSPALYFKDLMKGLLVYGAKVQRANTLFTFYADFVAEAT